MNKLELNGIMICEWDAETKCIIISAEEGYRIEMKTPPGNGVEFTEHGIRFNRPISEAHASMVTMEKMEGNGDELIGKWVKCTDGDGVLNFTPDRWYKCIGNVCEAGAFSGDFCGGGFSPNNHKHFDLTDARDYNPDERKPHQLKEYDAVECTPEERAEIIMIADECGVRVFAPTEPLEGQTSLLFFRGVISGTSIRSICDDAGIKRDWHTVPDFISKIRGEYTAVNVTEHKHESV